MPLTGFRRRLFTPAVILATGLIAFPGFTVLYVTQSQASQQVQITRAEAAARTAADRRWCATLRILTASPGLSPELRVTLVTLEKEFGCP